MTQTQFTFEAAPESKAARRARILAGNIEGVDAAVKYFDVRNAAAASALAKRTDELSQRPR